MKDDPDDAQQGDNQVQLVPPGVEVAVGAAKTTFLCSYCRLHKNRHKFGDEIYVNKLFRIARERSLSVNFV
jgi:hypothetical protein